MGLALLALVLCAPYPPQLGEPYDGAWVNGNGVYFWWDSWNDDAGIDPGSLRLEFRRADAGYGAFNDTQPWSRGRYTTITFPVENETWCWRAFNINANGQTSPPSVERCFRTDNTNPSSPPFVDAGAIVSTGRVVIEHTAAVDSVSGVAGYILTLSNSPTGPSFYDSSPREPGVPLVTYVGEGTWFGWIKVEDFALNSNNQMAGSYTIPITVTAVDAGFVPEAPTFSDAITPNYGSSLQWDAGAFAMNGVTHLVGSFCNTETVCRWEHAFVGLPRNPVEDGTWVQLGGEGTMVARIAVVIGGQVGPWSAPSAPIVVDRTAPPLPTNVAVVPRLSNLPNFNVRWYAANDERSGLLDAVVIERHVGTGAVREFEVAAPTISRDVVLMLDGVYEYRVRSRDRALNMSDPSMMIATATLDRAGPRARPPAASAVVTDGGALVALRWSAPTDELSGVTLVELMEQAIDGGIDEVTVTATSTQRFVPPGTWQWRMRGTDEAGNLGSPSDPSNVIVVTPGGVAQGPAITTSGPFSVSCGGIFLTTLEGTGDAPLSWSLISGPPGLVLVGSLLTWNPPAGTSGEFDVVVKLNNSVGFVNKTLIIDVACGAATDGGVDGGVDGSDGGSSQQPPRPRRDLVVGCGCASAESFALLALSLLALARSARRRG